MPSFLNNEVSMNNTIFNTDLISGKTNSTIVKISKLQNKKYRNDEKLFICDGVKLFLEAVEYNAIIRYIVLNNNTEFSTEIIDKIMLCKKNGVNVICVEDYIFDKLTTESAPQGIITVCEYLYNKHSFSNDIKVPKENEKILILESVRDPGNMGTILRNSVAFGIDRLIISSDCADIYSPKVIRSSMGAIFKQNIDVCSSLEQPISKLKENGKRILGAALKKNSLTLGKDTVSASDVFILGNEGHGISDDVLDLCDNTVFIPMKENTESLNVAIAAAILMWEISK